MPIVYVHGVSTRSSRPGYAVSLERLEDLLRQYVAPVLTPTPTKLALVPAYWGDVAAEPAWSGHSRPRGPILGMGADEPSAVDSAVAVAELYDTLQALPTVTQPRPAMGGLVPAGPQTDAASLRLRDLPPQQLSDLLVAAVDSLPDASAAGSAWVLAADAVAHDPKARAQLAAAADSQAEVDTLQRLVGERAEQLVSSAPGVTGMGGGSWLSGLGRRLKDVADRATHVPGFAASRALAEVRGPINDAVTGFIGDVFAYLGRRGTADQPGAIPTKVLSALADASQRRLRPDEPMIVVTHSMGGQIVYDLVTHFLPRMPQYRDLRVDFWCATASQVGLFEELKLFLASSQDYGRDKGNRVPFPADHLGHWWNVWDYNDFLSYSVREIFDGVDDGSYSSGLSVLGAHSGYLAHPSFFRTFAEKLESAAASGWSRV